MTTSFAIVEDGRTIDVQAEISDGAARIAPDALRDGLLGEAVDAEDDVALGDAIDRALRRRPSVPRALDAFRREAFVARAVGLAERFADPVSGPSSRRSPRVLYQQERPASYY